MKRSNACGHAMWWRYAPLVACLGAAPLACGQPPEMTVRVQGTVRSVGIRAPVAGARVTVEWPPALGSGQSILRTNASGQFAVGRTVRRREPRCEGLAITVLATGYASAYTRNEADCGDGNLSFDFALLPQPS